LLPAWRERTVRLPILSPARTGTHDLHAVDRRVSTGAT
jgi:hypothetical protein